MCILLQEWYGKWNYIICHTICVISWYNMFAFICIEYCKYLCQLTWVSQKLSCTVSTLVSWKLPWDRSDLSHFHGKGCDFPGLIITRNASTMLDVRYQHRSSPKISGVFPNSKISKFQTISSKFSCKGLAVRLSQANHQIGKSKKPKTLIGMNRFSI